MITDIHTHIFTEDDYANYFAKADGRVKKAVVIHNGTRVNTEGFAEPMSLEETSDFVAGKDNLALIGNFDAEKEAAPQTQQLKSLFEESKMVGIKIYPGYQYFNASDEVWNPVAELCRKYNKPLVIHTGDVYSYEGTAILKYAHPIHVDGLAYRFPDLKIVMAHFGFPYFMEAANVVSKNANVYTDISGTLDAADTREEERAMYEQYAADLKRVFKYFPDIRRKVMFGTDYGGEHTPLHQFEPYVLLTKDVFNKDEQPHVFRSLARSLFL